MILIIDVLLQLLSHELQWGRLGLFLCWIWRNMLFALVLNLNIGGDREVLLLNRLHIIIIFELQVAHLTYLSHSKSVLEVRWLWVRERRRLVCHTWIDCRGWASHAADLAQMQPTVVVAKVIMIDMLLQDLFIRIFKFYSFDAAILCCCWVFSLFIFSSENYGFCYEKPPCCVVFSSSYVVWLSFVSSCCSALWILMLLLR